MNPTSTQSPLQDRYLGTEDRYAIESILDQGGIGTIYLATDTRLNRKVAIKCLKKPLPGFAGMHQRFRQEVKLRAAIGSEYVVKILDSGTNAAGYPFYTMEYFQGQSLEQVLQHEKLLPIEQAIDIARQICLAMEAFHRGEIESSKPFEVISQDLKPAHIFLLSTASGEQVKVLDSSLAKRIHNYCSDSHYTHLKSLLPGTCQYSAPEQLKPEEATDHRADIYTLGVILFEMFSGTNPFSLEANSQFISDASWVHAHINQTPRPLQSLLGNCRTSCELSDIVSKCLQKIPSDRYSSVQALREALELVEVSDRLSPDRTQSYKQSQRTTTSNIDSEPSLVQLSEDSTFNQAENLLSEAKKPEAEENNDETVVQAEESNDETVVQTAPDTRTRPQNSHPSAVLTKHLPVSIENPRVADSIDPSNPLHRAFEAECATPKPIEPFASQNNCQDLSSAVMGASDEEEIAENTIVQHSAPAIHHPADQTVTQYSDPVIHRPVDQTIIQYSDSAIHSPGDQTVAQAISSLPDRETDQTVHQGGVRQAEHPQNLSIAQNNRVQSHILSQNISQNMLQRIGSFTSRFINIPGRFFHSIWTMIDLKQWQSRFHPNRQLAAAGTSGRQPSLSPIAPPTHRPARDGMSTEAQPSSEKHQKAMRELDHCRLSFAKELARNGKFRDAIAMAKQISETSRSFKDAQTLMRSWKQF